MVSYLLLVVWTSCTSLMSNSNSSIESWCFIDIFLPGCTVSPILMNGVLLAVCPDKCLSNFSLLIPFLQHPLLLANC